MVRAGLIFGLAMLVLGGGAAFFLPLCVPCLALFAGAGAGYLAAQWERPSENVRAIGRGAGAGAIAGVGAWLAHVIGGLAGAARIGPERSAEFTEQMLRAFGSDVSVPTLSLSQFYGQAAFFACCFGVFEVMLMAGLGALGGLLWWQMTGKAQNGPGSLA